MSVIAVVGSANVDLITQVPRRPLGGETLIGGSLHTLPGGKGANQAAAAAKAGGSVRFVGRVGSDGNGEFLRSALHSAGVVTDALESTDSPTGTAIIMLTPDGENSIVVCPGANHDFSPAQAQSSASQWRDASVVVLSCEIPFETVSYVCGDAEVHGTRVVVNAAPATLLPSEVLQVCDPLIVNEHEAQAVLGTSEDPMDEVDYRNIATQLMDAGARSVIITLGVDGVVVADHSGCTQLPAFEVSVVDTTGAGDAFVGATCAALAQGELLSSAAMFGQAMAALSVTALGAQASYPSYDEIISFVRDHGQQSCERSAE